MNERSFDASIPNNRHRRIRKEGPVVPGQEDTPMSPARLPAGSINCKRSVVIGGHKTSISLENEFWNHLRRIAQRRGTTVSLLLSEIDETRDNPNLSSAARVYILKDLENEIAALTARRNSRPG